MNPHDNTRNESSGSDSSGSESCVHATKGRPICRIDLRENEKKPGFFTEELHPGAQVLFSTEEVSTTVTFEGPSPLVGVEKSFKLYDGPPVAFTVRPGASGHYPFHFEGLSAGRTLMVAVSPSGSLEKLGFHNPRREPAILRSYVHSPDGSVELHLGNLTTDRHEVDLFTMDSPGRRFELPPGGETVQESIVSAGFGTRVRARLVHSGKFDPNQQAGGTEQIEIIVEPDS